MVAYDPDERITAHQALQHPYFWEQRVAEMQAQASRRHASFPEHHKWPIPEDRKQKAPLWQAAPARPSELPPLWLSATTTLSSHSSPTLRALKFGGARKEVDTQDTQSDRPWCCLPTINQKGARD